MMHSIALDASRFVVAPDDDMDYVMIDLDGMGLAAPMDLDGSGSGGDSIGGESSLGDDSSFDDCGEALVPAMSASFVEDMGDLESLMADAAAASASASVVSIEDPAPPPPPARKTYAAAVSGGGDASAPVSDDNDSEDERNPEEEMDEDEDEEEGGGGGRGRQALLRPQRRRPRQGRAEPAAAAAAPSGKEREAVQQEEEEEDQDAEEEGRGCHGGRRLGRDEWRRRRRGKRHQVDQGQGIPGPQGHAGAQRGGGTEQLSGRRRRRDLRQVPGRAQDQGLRRGRGGGGPPSVHLLGAARGSGRRWETRRLRTAARGINEKSAYIYKTGTGIGRDTSLLPGTRPAGRRAQDAHPLPKYYHHVSVARCSVYRKKLSKTKTPGCHGTP